MATHQPRRRPLAGERSRPRLEPEDRAARTASPMPPTPPPASAEGREPAPVTVPRSRRTALLERARPEPAGAETAPPARRARRAPDLVLLVAALVTVALLLTAAALTVKARGEDRTERARTEAVAAAESRAVDLLSYDYRHLGRDFGRAGKGLTGQFADDYAHTTETVVRPTAEEVKAVVKAEVVASSVVRASQDRVVVLLFVNQTTTSTRVEGPQVDLNRVRMTLTRVGGDWKVSAVTAL
jgi:Mce-associated membrane protein